LRKEEGDDFVESDGIGNDTLTGQCALTEIVALTVR